MEFPSKIEGRFLEPFEAISITQHRLPHWQQDNAIYFNTFRLGDSLPASIREPRRKEMEWWLKENPKPWVRNQEVEFWERFGKWEQRLLDKGYGSCVFKRPDCRSLLENVLMKYEGLRYQHLSWVIMPNHVHLLTIVFSGISLEDLLKPWKGVSARQVNKVIGAQGPLWQEDYRDTLIRDTVHLHRCIRYIRSNPVKARLPAQSFTLYENEYAAGIC